MQENIRRLYYVNTEWEIDRRRHAIISKPKTFVAGAVALAADVNSDFDTIYSDYNGGITNANIASGAAIAYTKISGLSDVLKRTIILKAFGDTESVLTGDGKVYITIPAEFSGMNLIVVGMAVYTKSTSGLPTVTLERGRRASATAAPTYVDMLSTALTIDANEFDSKTATTAAVINTANDDVLEADIIRVNVETSGTGTQGLEVRMTFQTP